MTLRDKIVALALQGMAARQIAKRVRAHLSTVYRHMNEAGVPMTHVHPTAPLANREKVLALVSKHGVAGAAEKLNVSRQAIYLRMAEWLSSA